MARKLDKIAIQQRIKSNLATMKDAKKEVTDNMNSATKGGTFDVKASRKALSDFLKAAQSVADDTAKLQSITE